MLGVKPTEKYKNIRIPSSSPNHWESEVKSQKFASENSALEETLILMEGETAWADLFLHKTHTERILTFTLSKFYHTFYGPCPQKIARRDFTLSDWLFLDEISCLLPHRCVDWWLGKLKQHHVHVCVGVCVHACVCIWDHVLPKTVLTGGSNGPKNQLPALPQWSPEPLMSWCLLFQKTKK